jgi:glycosyltransferase involved in cell wall biosynthesis
MAIARELGLPGIVTARGTDINVLAQVPAVRRQIAAAMPHARALFAVSDALRRSFDEVLDTKGQVLLARNGVDLEVFRPGDRADARHRLGLPADRPLVLGVGRLVESKGFHHAAAALARLGGDAVLVLVGEGPDRERIRGLLPPGRLMLLGGRRRDEVALAYQACDLLVLPSWREGWPNVVTEALASGLPVVASRVGGIPEICGDAAAAILVAPGDEVALCAALRQFLASPPDPAQVRALATRYSWSDTVSMLSALLLELVA